MGESAFDTKMTARAPRFATRFSETGATFKAQGSGSFISSSLVRAPSEVEEVFDTGTDDLDFDLDVAYQLVSDNAAPKVTSRDGVGDQFKFSESSSVIWYLRRIVEHGRTGGGWHKYLIANSNGPIEGV